MLIHHPGHRIYRIVLRTARGRHQATSKGREGSAMHFFHWATGEDQENTMIQFWSDAADCILTVGHGIIRKYLV